MTPSFSIEEASQIAQTHFGIAGELTPLVAYEDQNFKVVAKDGSAWVLKIARAGTSADTLDLQNQALVYLEARHPEMNCPCIVPTFSGALMQSVKGRGHLSHYARMLSFLEGTFWVDAGPHTPEANHVLGAYFGRLDACLKPYTHPAMAEPHEWDLKHAATVRPRTVFIPELERRALVERFFEIFARDVAPVLPALRHQVIHGDGNEHNVLVETDAPDRIAGVIDFGDLGYTCTVCEPAIVAAYGILGQADPLAAATQIVAGYHTEWPLTDAEIRVLFPLMALRLCVSVTQSAHGLRDGPENAYRQATAGPAWAVLEQLASVDPAQAEAQFRSALQPAS